MTEKKHALMPWEVPDEEPPLERSLEGTVAAIQRDMAFACRHTGVLVRSSNEALRLVVNTERGQVLPPGVGTFTDGTTIEMQDLGMPQPGCPTMTVQELVKTVMDKATELGLELA